MWGEVAPGGEVNEPLNGEVKEHLAGEGKEHLIGEVNELLIGEVKEEEGDMNYWVDLVKIPPHPRRCCRNQPLHHTSLNEETLGLLHRENLVEVLHLDQHLNCEVNEPLNGEVKEEEGEMNHWVDLVKNYSKVLTAMQNNLMAASSTKRLSV